MSEIINIFPEKVKDIQEKLIEKWHENGGMPLERSDSRKLILDAMAYGFALFGASLNDKVEQNLLRYSEGAYLDELGEFKNVTRLEPKFAKTTVKFKISKVSDKVIVIPSQTITPGNNIFFETESVEVPAETTEIAAIATCTVSGEIGNGYLAGEINKMVTICSNIESVENIDESQGGSDIESDESYRERIQIAPETYSVAGSKEAYEYWTKTANQQIKDVVVYTTKELSGKVSVVILLEGGEFPDSTICTEVMNYLSNSKVRPLTDVIEVKAPDSKNLNLDLDYYISNENKTIATEIESKIETAIDEYISWQIEKIGRDINPSELIFRLKEAGAKRVVVRNPVYTVVEKTESAVLVNKQCNYMGQEDD